MKNVSCVLHVTGRELRVACASIEQLVGKMQWRVPNGGQGITIDETIATQISDRILPLIDVLEKIILINKTYV